MVNQPDTGGPAAVRRGRFAPSPSGPLHFGSLIAAVGSYLQARAAAAPWLLRIEDVDTPRVVAGAAERIIATLDAYGFVWDGPVSYQSRRFDRYAAALTRLRDAGRVFACSCSRRDIAAIARPGPEGFIYPGSCRNGPTRADRRPCWRLRVEPLTVRFRDGVLGDYAQPLADAVGDFVLRRADGVYSYQLAVVVDDAEQGISDIVRGSDLLSSTPRQIYLQRLLGLPQPRYFHLPVGVDAAGRKLSKQHGAAPLDDARPVPALLAALDFLGQRPPPALAAATRDEVWRWALANWRLQAIPARRERTVVREA